MPQLKVERRHAVAEVALAGRLDPDRLRALAPHAALAELQELPGIGPFYSTLVLVRSSGHADPLPEGEGRVFAAAAHHYGLDRPPSPERFAELAEAWRPSGRGRACCFATRRRETIDVTAGLPGGVSACGTVPSGFLSGSPVSLKRCRGLF